MCMLNEHVRGLREIFFPRVLEVQAIIFFTEGEGGPKRSVTGNFTVWIL